MSPGPSWEPLEMEAVCPKLGLARRGSSGLMSSSPSHRCGCLAQLTDSGAYKRIASMWETNWKGFTSVLLLVLAALIVVSVSAASHARRLIPIPCEQAHFPEHALTNDPQSWHVLSNERVWSPDSRRVVYDVRSNHLFNGDRIATVGVTPGAGSSILYQGDSQLSGGCGIALFLGGARAEQVAFIKGPAGGDPHWAYSFWHRHGVLQNASNPGQPLQALDARDVGEPFTPGALRGGTHVHKSSGDGLLVASNYEDAVLQDRQDALRNASEAELLADANRRLLAVTILDLPVFVMPRHPRNINGSFTVVVTTVHDNPAPGSDEVRRTHDHAWVGVNGYVTREGISRRYAIAFLGQVLTTAGELVSQVFVVDLPNDPVALTRVAPGMPLEGTFLTRPLPPANVTQRRLTALPHGVTTAQRFWPTSSADGRRVAFLADDAAGVTQLWTISPTATPGEERQLTVNSHSVSSSFTWSPNGRWLAHRMDGSMCVTNTATGATLRLTPAQPDAALAPRPEAAVFSPDGRRIASMRGEVPQIWALDVSGLQTCIADDSDGGTVGSGR